MPKKKTKKKIDKDKVIETLYAELERKDKLIEKLKEENLLLMKTALKAAEKQKKAEEKLGK
jgi:hypothetical protein